MLFPIDKMPIWSSCTNNSLVKTYLHFENSGYFFQLNLDLFTICFVIWLHWICLIFAKNKMEKLSYKMSISHYFTDKLYSFLAPLCCCQTQFLDLTQANSQKRNIYKTWCFTSISLAPCKIFVKLLADRGICDKLHDIWIGTCPH